MRSHVDIVSVLEVPERNSVSVLKDSFGNEFF